MMRDFASKSPRSVTHFIGSELLATQLPCLKPLSRHEQHNTSPIRALRKMNHVVNVIKAANLERRNQKQKRRSAKRRKQKQRRLMFRREEETLRYDEENSVLSVLDPTLPVPEDDGEIPWDEQDYEEFPWYEYPDLDEDDEITVLIKRVVGSGVSPQYVGRVEATVWTFAVKLQNLVQFKLHHHTTLEELKRAKSKAPKSPPSPKRKQVVSITYGLPQELHAEKRRYRRHQEELAKERSAPTKETEKKENLKNTKTEEEEVKTPAASPVKRTIIRKPTPATNKVVLEESRDRITCWVRPKSSDSRPIRPKRIEEKQRAVRIGKLKARQVAIKMEQERLEREEAERKAMAKKMEEQQKRLERLRRGQSENLLSGKAVTL